MPSPFHQKYATQNHRIFTKTSPQDEQRIQAQMGEERRASTTSTSSFGSATSTPTSPTQQRRKSSTSGFAGLEAMKRDPNLAARRASYTDARPAPGILGQWWNNFTRGPGSPPAAAPKKEPRDTTTLRQ